MSSKRLETKLGSLHLANPISTASGTFGYAEEFAQYEDLNSLGSIVTKSISLQPREGNASPRIYETPSGMLNAIGLENVGVNAFIKHKLPFLKTLKTKVIISIAGHSRDEYIELAQKLNAEKGIAALELNLSCPNVDGGLIASDKTQTRELVEGVSSVTSLPLIAKLTPNVTSIVDTAEAALAGGADALSMINTLLGMAIDIKTRKPLIANITGGLSGPCVKPVALRCVYQVHSAFPEVPIMGVGGISKVEDVIEFLLAGASAVQIGTQNFVEPAIAERLVNELETYLEAENVSVQELIGALKV